jgi:hypothetical protein
VGTYECLAGEADLMEKETAYRIVSKIVMPEKTIYRFIGKTLPAFAEAVKPTLEDAYVFVMASEEGDI